MKYLVAEFKIECQDGMIQIARDLLTDALGEAGFETFEDTEEGINGYVQESLFDENAMNDVISNFMLPDVTINANIQEAEYKNWNEEWEEAGFERININDSITIYDARHDDGNGIASGISIGIETKQAFGTGTHETTRMIVSTLLNIDLKGKRVLDCFYASDVDLLIEKASSLGLSKIDSKSDSEWTCLVLKK